MGPPQSPDRVLPSCSLCGREVEPHRASGRRCEECLRRIAAAETFRQDAFQVPQLFRGAAGQHGLDPQDSYLLWGPYGAGKSHRAWGHLQWRASQDPRLTVAAFSWPKALVDLQRGYQRNDGSGDQIITWLQQADLALLDDLAAERITEQNLGWIRQQLYVVLDTRWVECRATILTTNLQPNLLPDYLGDRIVSRVLGMCRLEEVAGPDRRLEP